MVKPGDKVAVKQYGLTKDGKTSIRHTSLDRGYTVIERDTDLETETGEKCWVVQKSKEGFTLSFSESELVKEW